jgi:hypothetical protein
MKRVLTLATAGLFMAGLAVLPMSAWADQMATGGKSVTPTPSASTMTPAAPLTSGVQTSTVPAKKLNKVTSAPTGATTPLPSGTTVKTPVKGAS